jgi:hypothetical protein
MSEILSNIVVEQTNINFAPDNNNINITPEAIQLSIFTGAAPVAGGPNTSVQYSDSGVLQGSSAFTFNNVTNVVNIDTANITDLSVINNSNLGNVANITITGGINGYVLQTDGTGNLAWAAQTGGGGNGSPGGSNTQIQFNDAGLFGGAVGFTFDKTTNAFSAPGNIFANSGTISASLLAGTLTTAAQPNITSIGTLSALNVGFISLSGNLNANGTVAALNFNGSGNLLTDLNGANIFGNVPASNTAITVTSNSQPNITSVGTLTTLAVSGNFSGSNITSNTTITGSNIVANANITSNNANLGNLATANFFQGDGSLLSNINGANIVGNLSRISNGTSNVNIPTANGNITFNVGGVANIAVISNTALNTSNLRLNSSTIILGGNTPNSLFGDCVVIGNSAGNANTSLGSVVIGRDAGNSLTGTFAGRYDVTIGPGARRYNSGNTSVTIGAFAGENSVASESVFLGQTAGALANGLGSIGVGYESLSNGSSNYQIAIGHRAGANSPSGVNSVAMGVNAARQNQLESAVAIGNEAGRTNQGNLTVAIGSSAGAGTSGVGQGTGAVAIGHNSGRDGQGTNGVSIGTTAGLTNQGANAIAIGVTAGATSQGANGIAIGSFASTSGQSANAIAIGATAGQSAQGVGAIAIGRSAGVLQGQFSIALGANSGTGGANIQANNSIAINATGTDFEAPIANALFVKPIRELNNLSSSVLDYNTTTGEITSHLRTFGSFTSNATQTSNGANTTNYMTLNNTEDANGISIASSTQITVARIGRYNIQFSAQLEKTDSGTDIIEIWLDKNGTAVANSATQIELAGNNAKSVAAWDFNVNAANVNDYFRLAWASPDTDVQITAVPAANTISGVAIPSVILDINPIGA